MYNVQTIFPLQGSASPEVADLRLRPREKRSLAVGRWYKLSVSILNSPAQTIHAQPLSIGELFIFLLKRGCSEISVKSESKLHHKMFNLETSRNHKFVYIMKNEKLQWTVHIFITGN